jgi:dynein heavy chain
LVFKLIKLSLKVHEVFRVFYDRLVDDLDRKWLYEYVVSTTSECFRDNFHAIFSNLDSEQTGVVSEDNLRSLMFCDFGDPNIKKYMEVKDINVIKQIVETNLEEYNLINKRPMSLVMFKYVSLEYHLLDIKRFKYSSYN